MNRSLRCRRVVIAAAVAALLILPRDAAADEDQQPTLDWHTVTAADVSGKGWSETKRPFDRLPSRAQGVVREPVWELAQHSSGIYVDFVTDAPSISVRWTLTSSRLAMPHMAATGVSGVDLYLHRDGTWQFLAVGQPRTFPTNEATLVNDMQPEPARYRLYLPLYNGVSGIEIGVPKGASFEIATGKGSVDAPVVIYGTSITQGGCASRPGMSYPAILGRQLQIPVANLGFSGNGKAEEEIAELLSELNASAYIIDPLPNLFPQQVAERLPKFIEILRRQHPTTPILLVESPSFPDMPYSKSRADRVNESNARLQQVYRRRVESGDDYIFLVQSCDLTGDGGEGTVDGIHATDVGFLLLAESIKPRLEAALRLSKKEPDTQ